MLEKIDLTKTLKQKQFQSDVKTLSVRLAKLQRDAQELGIPVIILVEGWGAAGKGTVINELINPLEPRHFKVHSIKKATDEEIGRPFLWRFWTKTPERGKFVIFDRSWYSKVLVERVDKQTSAADLQSAYDEITSFERLMTDDGTVIIKLFLHICADEQRRRFKQLESKQETAWRVTKEDWVHNKQYGEYIKVYNEMFERTDQELAPWTVIEANDIKFAVIKTFSTVVAALESKIASNRASKPMPVANRLPQGLGTSVLASVDLSKTIEKRLYKEKLAKHQETFKRLQNICYQKGIPIVILFEGWDASGKGGAIRRLTRCLDPRNYEVFPIAAPTPTELAHHYLWRFWNTIPRAGHISIYDRSWYGRVLVERVENLATSEQWQRAYREINELEAHLANFGAVIIKFWMHIDKDEQERRFNQRMLVPEKQWKLTDEDWRNRDKWADYTQAVDEMLLKTSTTYAPWTVVEGNSKQYARLKVLETVIDRL